jgi:exonuclease SbcD
LLELDFGEAGEQKRVVVVEAEPGVPATVRSLPLSAGRRLVRVRGEWQELLKRDDVHDSYLDVTVQTAGPDPGLVDRAREEFDHLVHVRADYPRVDSDSSGRGGRSLDELYGMYYENAEGVAAPEELLVAFRQVMDEVGYAAP